jgi:hypothetical protein
MMFLPSKKGGLCRAYDFLGYKIKTICPHFSEDFEALCLYCDQQFSSYQYSVKEIKEEKLPKYLSGPVDMVNRNPLKRPRLRLVVAARSQFGDRKGSRGSSACRQGS